MMLMRKWIVALLLLPVMAMVVHSQVIHTTAALDVDNVFTGNNTFNGNDTFNGVNTFSQSLILTESACQSGASATVVLCDDPTSHRLKFNPNNAGALTAVGISATGVAGNCTQLAANGIDIVDAGVTCGGGGGGSVNGSGTVGTLPLWTPNTTTLGNSLIVQAISGNGTVQITRPDSTHLGNLAFTNGYITSTTIFTPTATCGSSCFAINVDPQYRGTAAAAFNGINEIAIFTPANTSGTITSNSVSGMSLLTQGAGSTGGGTSNVTNLYGISNVVNNASVSPSVGTVTNQFGMFIQSGLSGGDNTYNVTNNKGLDVITALASGGSTSHIANDYSIYIEPTIQGTNDGTTNHTGLYIADQGRGNSTNNTWYGVFIAPQQLGFGFNKPTPAIGLGGVNVYTGAGTPTLNCGTTPSLYLNNTAASVATLEYGCISGTTWTAISGGGGGGVTSVFGRTGAVVATTGDYTAAQVTNAVSTAAANTGAAAMTLNMAASTSAASFRLPNIAGASSTTVGAMSYDLTNKNIHAGANGVDNLMGLLPSSIAPVNNDCVKWTVAAGVVTLNTAGTPCGTTSGITGSGTSTTIPVFTGTSVIGNSLLTDDGTTLNYSGTGGATFTSTAAGYAGLGQGTAQGLSVNAVGLTVPSSVTAYNLIFPGAANNGYMKWSNSSNLVTGSFHSVVDTIGSNLDLTGQSASLGSQTLVASAPVAGRYNINYYVSESAGCATPGPGVVTATFAWTDATVARSLVSSTLTFTAASGAGDTIRGTIPVWAASASAITVITTYTACTTGTATYDIHAWVTEAQ